VLPHVERAFKLTFVGTTLADWRLRNAYNQLFAALVRRVFGNPNAVQESVLVHPRCKLSALEFFTRFPSLYGLIAQNLRRSVHHHINGSPSFFDTFALLILLTHIHPSGLSAASLDGDSVNSQQEQSVVRYDLTPFAPDLIRVLFTAKAHKTRELAAAALVSVLRRPELLSVLSWVSGVIMRFEHEQPKNNMVDSLICLLSIIAQTDGLLVKGKENNASVFADDTNPDYICDEEILDTKLLFFCKRMMYQVLYYSTHSCGSLLKRYWNDMINTPELSMIDKLILKHLR